jgi:lipoprotein-releasing system permease protein
MPFQWFVALRYMRDARGQTALILAAVSVGVSVIVFLSALINGLQASLVATTLGSQPHVTMRAPREEPRPLVAATAERVVARSIQPASQRLRSIDQWPSVMVDAARQAGVTAVSPTVTGSGVVTRLDANLPIVIRGVEPDRFVAIIDLPARMVDGHFEVGGGLVVVGTKLAAELGVSVGDKLRLTSTEDVDDVVTVAGVFALGNDAVDRTWVVTSLRHAQALFALPGGVTGIEMKVRDVFDAERVATVLRDQTRLEAESWMTLNASLLSGLSAQASSKTMIQFFVVLTVALGIASVLIVSVVQKSREIGILRAVGTPAHRVLTIFLIQGGVLGLAGSIVGSALGVTFAKGFEVFTSNPDGAPRFLVLVDLSLLLSATLLATSVGLLAAMIPALRASRLDPASAIRGG